MQEEITKEYDEKKTELEPKVIEIYGTTSTEIKVRRFSLSLSLSPSFFHRRVSTTYSGSISGGTGAWAD